MSRKILDNSTMAVHRRGRSGACAEGAAPLAKRRKRPAQLVVRGSSLLAGASLLLACLGVERRAEAQERFGDKGQLVIAAENLFSISTERFGRSPAGGDQSVTSTHFGFLLSGQRVNGTVSPIGPMVGGHYFIIPSLSVGGTIGYEARGGSTTQQLATGDLTQDRPSETTFVFLPKVGYALGINQMLGFWFRGGLGVGVVGTSGPQDNVKASETFWLFSADALFTMTPFNHVGFYVGPQANLSISGTESSTNGNGVETSISSSFRSFGFGVGLFGYVDL